MSSIQKGRLTKSIHSLWSASRIFEITSNRMIGINNYSRILIWVELFRSLIFSWHLTYVLFLISFTKKTLLLTLNPHSVKLILLLFPYGDNIIHLIKYIMVVFQALFVFRESGNFKNLHVKTMMSRT